MNSRRDYKRSIYNRETIPTRAAPVVLAAQLQGINTRGGAAMTAGSAATAGILPGVKEKEHRLGLDKATYKGKKYEWGAGLKSLLKKN